MRDDDAVELALQDTTDRLARLEAETAEREEAAQRARAFLQTIRSHRRRGRVPMWEGAQRAAARSVLLALGCGLIIAGATALDAAAGTVALVLTFAALAFEGAR